MSSCKSRRSARKGGRLVPNTRQREPEPTSPHRALRFVAVSSRRMALGVQHFPTRPWKRGQEAIHPLNGLLPLAERHRRSPINSPFDFRVVVDQVRKSRLLANADYLELIGRVLPNSILRRHFLTFVLPGNPWPGPYSVPAVSTSIPGDSWRNSMYFLLVFAWRRRR